MLAKTARMTVLIDPARKQAFGQLCHSQDFTPSQVVRKLIREYIDEHTPATRVTGRTPKAALKSKRSQRA